MALPVATREALADAFIALGDLVSLHTADPGLTGANEQSGGSAAREQTVWSADATDDGERVGTQVTVDVPAGTFTHLGIWSSDGTIFRGGGPITNTVMSAPGQIKVTPKYVQS
jgi:hypothetical protein